MARVAGAQVCHDDAIQRPHQFIKDRIAALPGFCRPGRGLSLLLRVLAEPLFLLAFSRIVSLGGGLYRPASASATPLTTGYLFRWWSVRRHAAIDNQFAAGYPCRVI
jgi:hypothetical protein